MKVKIGNYKSYFGPYQIAEKILFWTHEDDDRVYKLAKWLNTNKNGDDSRLAKLCEWIFSKRKREVKIHLDPYDTFNMDATLSLIILPMLKQLKKNQHGSPNVDPKDVPKHLRPKKKPSHKNGYVDDTHHERWEWVLDEMIWAFEQNQPDCEWEYQYYSGVNDWQFVDGHMVKGPNHTHEVDMKGLKAHEARMQNGMILFGKYFRSLWD